MEVQFGGGSSESTFPGRDANMLSDLIAPGCTTFAAEAFKEQFLEFENPVQGYGVPSCETLGSSLMVAVIVMSRHSPPKLRSALRYHITTTGTDYQKLRTIVNDFLTSVLEFTSAAVVSASRVTSANDVPVPMDVGGKQETRERAIEGTKEGPRLEPKVFKRISEVTDPRAEFGYTSVPNVRRNTSVHSVFPGHHHHRQFNQVPGVLLHLLSVR